MGQFVTLVLVSLIALFGSVVIAPPAEAISCVSADNVTALGPGGCDLGGLNFSSFAVSAVGLTGAKIFLGDFSAVKGAHTNLAFQMVHEPSPANLADILFTYTVKTLSGLPGLVGVDLFNGGQNVTIQERVCGSPFDNDIVCQAGLLAEYAVPGNSMASATFPAASTLFIRKDIHLLSDSFISEFTNSHELAPVPEPATLLLLGSTFAAVGMAVRRRVARKAG
jgi:hypothetical protein